MWRLPQASGRAWGISRGLSAHRPTAGTPRRPPAQALGASEAVAGGPEAANGSDRGGVSQFSGLWWPNEAYDDEAGASVHVLPCLIVVHRAVEASKILAELRLARQEATSEDGLRRVKGIEGLMTYAQNYDELCIVNI